jgi:hypothetical protein
VVDEQTIFSKVFDQTLSDLIVGHDHALLDELLAVQAGFDSNVDRVVLFVQLETDFILVEDFSIHSVLSLLEGNLSEQFYLLAHLIQSLESDALALDELLSVLKLVINDPLSLIVGQLGRAVHYRLFKP